MGLKAHTDLYEQLLPNVQLEHPDNEMRLLLVHLLVPGRDGVRALHAEVHQVVQRERRVQVNTAHRLLVHLHHVQVLGGRYTTIDSAARPYSSEPHSNPGGKRQTVIAKLSVKSKWR